MSIIFGAHILRVLSHIVLIFSGRILDKKKPSIMEGEKTGMVSMARKNRVCTYYTFTTRTALRLRLTPLARLLGIACRA